MKQGIDHRMYSYYREYTALPEHSRSRGRLIEEIAKAEDIDPSTVHRRFGKYKNKEFAGTRKDKGAPRFTVESRRITREEKLRYCILVSGLKQALLSKEGKTADTESLVRALHNRGEMPLVPRGTMDKWLNEFGLAIRQIKRLNGTATCTLKGRYPNEMWMIDSTVSELFYLRDSSGNRLIKDTSGILTDKNHREEILTRKGYSKLLLFVVVDLFSSAFWYRAYVTPGESSAVYLRFLLEAFGKKADERNVFRGIPFMLYCDKGSGIGKSSVIIDVCNQLGIKIITHAPGNPGAKGKVESRIGKIKSRIEKWMSVERISTVDRYNELGEKFIVEENINKGFYQLWSHIHKTPERLREFNPDLRERLVFNNQVRTIDNRGCVSLGGVDYLVNRSLKDERVEIYTLPDGTLKAVDRFQRTYALTDSSALIVHPGEYRVPRKTEQDRLIEAAATEGKRLRKILRPEDFIDNAPENVRIFDRQGVEHAIESPVDSRPFASVEDAWYYICRQTGRGKRELPEQVRRDIDDGLRGVLSVAGAIDRELVHTLIDHISNLTLEVQAL